jgi:hypothetical protein
MPGTGQNRRSVVTADADANALTGRRAKRKPRLLE